MWFDLDVPEILFSLSVIIQRAIGAYSAVILT